jgi:hypothetical protein
MRTRKGLAGLLLAVVSVVAAVVLRRRATRGRERVELYFADGSLVTLAEGKDQADALLRHASGLLAEARAGAR